MGNDKAPTFFLNPRIVSYGEATESKNEGCLSVPNKIGSVERSTEVLLSWYDHNNKRYEYKFDGFWAQAVQHEMDHLEGTLYIDKATEVHTEEEMRAKWEAAQEITKMSSEELEKEVISDMQSPLVELEKNQ
jgi:peptide deformylase